jgi:hypothetical protein
VWVRIGPVAIVAIAAVRKAQFEHFAHLFEQSDRLIDGRQAGRGTVSLDLLVDLLHTGMSVARNQDSEHGYTLWREATSPLSDLFYERLQSNLWIKQERISPRIMSSRMVLLLENKYYVRIVISQEMVSVKAGRGKNGSEHSPAAAGPSRR